MSRNTKALPFFKPYIRRREVRAVRQVLKSGWLTTGSVAQAFEAEFSEFLSAGRPDGETSIHALAVTSATAGLHLALEAVGVAAGDRVAVPSLTFTASAEVIRYLGADPIFIDSEPVTGNMDPTSLRAAAERAREEERPLKAVIVVHLAGMPCDMDAVVEAVAGDGTAIIEDAAHAFPARTPRGPAGTLGDIGVFSFYATKTITTGEGGMVVTAREDYAERMRIMRLHGIDRTVWNRYRSGAGARAWEYDVVAAGFKYNMTDIAAALGRVQLSRADRLLEMRRRLASEYSEGLRDLAGIRLPIEDEAHARHLYVLTFDEPENRSRAIESLHRAGIGTSVHFIPLHRLTYWKSRYQLNPEDLPVAEHLADRILSLPLWPGMGVKAVRRTVDILRRRFRG